MPEHLQTEPRQQTTPDSQETQAPAIGEGRRGAIGKALIVWLATGSLGAAVVAFLVFKGMGC